MTDSTNSAPDIDPADGPDHFDMEDIAMEIYIVQNDDGTAIPCTLNEFALFMMKLANEGELTSNTDVRRWWLVDDVWIDSTDTDPS